MVDISTHSGNKLTEEQIEQLIKRLRGVQPIERIVTIEDSNVSNEKMAMQDVFGSTNPAITHWLTNVEIYKAVGTNVAAECIKGIQRIRDMWRVYMDNIEDIIILNCGRFKSTWQAGTPSHTKSSEFSNILT
jgi:hypothetical protein